MKFGRGRARYRKKNLRSRKTAEKMALKKTGGGSILAWYILLVDALSMDWR
jgi:hypothetical protein